MSPVLTKRHMCKNYHSSVANSEMETTQMSISSDRMDASCLSVQWILHSSEKRGDHCDME